MQNMFHILCQMWMSVCWALTLVPTSALTHKAPTLAAVGRDMCWPQMEGTVKVVMSMGTCISASCCDCLDENECMVGDNSCEHNCTNTVGSYKCSCAVGYIVNSNGFNCDGRYNSYGYQSVHNLRISRPQ